MKDFYFGFAYPLKCAELFLRYPKLIAISIVPMMINLVIYGTIFYLVFTKANEYSSIFSALSEKDNLLLDAINVLLRIAVFLIVLLICYVLFTIFGGIVSSPFNEFISKFVEEKVFGIRFENDMSFLTEVFISIREEIKKLAFYFAVVIPLFGINFIPMIGSTISLAVGMPFSFYYNALDFMDYPLNRYRAGFRKKLGIINRNLPVSMGFGATAFLFMFLPVVNVIMKPLLVVTGTSLFYEKKFDKLI